MNQAEWEQSVTWVGVVAGCVVQQDEKYLLVQEKQQKVYGLWNLPAGYVDKGETIEAAAVREAREETGYEVELIREIGIYHEAIEKPVKHAFAARIVGGKLGFESEEILDVKWLTFAEIERLNEEQQIRAPWVWDAIQKVQNFNS